MELEKSGKTELLEMVRNISDMVDIHYIRQKEPKGIRSCYLLCKSICWK